jgi:hypothetical protein
MDPGIGQPMSGSGTRRDSKHSLFFSMPKYVYFAGGKIFAANDGKPEW